MKYNSDIIIEKINEKSNSTVILIGDYINTDIPFNLECKRCGHNWKISPRSYFQNKTICPNCNSNRGGKLCQEEVKNRIQNILGSEYQLIGLYFGKREKITLKHSCGNEYKVWPNDIWQKHLGECLICKDNVSIGHRTIRKYLKNYVIFEEEKTFQNCIGVTGIKLPFDFYIPIFNLIIEFDGSQHFKPKFGEDINGIEFQRTQRNDKIKNDYCKNNNINILRISYLETKKIDEILEKTFNDYRKGN